MRALYVGRFQPFHKGHLRTVEKILEETDELIIGIGSAQYSHTLKNPFTCGERIEMIRRTLDDLSRIIVVPITDLHIHGIWVKHLCNVAPKFDVVYSNEPLTVRLFREEGFVVKPFPLYSRGSYDSTKIRSKIIKGENWKEDVPKEVYKFIKEIKGDERLKDIARSDKV